MYPIRFRFVDLLREEWMDDEYIHALDEVVNKLQSKTINLPFYTI